MKKKNGNNLISLNGLTSVRLMPRSLRTLVVYDGYSCLMACCPRTLTPKGAGFSGANSPS